MSIKVSQGGVAIHLMCGGIFNDQFVTQTPMSLLVKKNWKSINIWWSYGH